MKKPIDDRVELPLLFKHLLISVIGISGVALVLKGGEQPDYTDSLIVFLLAIFSGCATFGLFSILAILKQGGSFKDVIKKLIDNIDIVFKDDSRN
tara:strand:- start:490 stop:774 length:285 start_codon:yes stop_codon:yes gene_type:complete